MNEDIIKYYDDKSPPTAWANDSTVERYDISDDELFEVFNKLKEIGWTK